MIQQWVNGKIQIVLPESLREAPIEFPKPIVEIAVHAKTKVDEDKLGPAMQRVAAEDPEDRGHVCVVHKLLVASEETRDVAAGQSGFTYDVRLPDIVPFGDPIQGRAEVAHNFFAGRVPFYGNSDLTQRIADRPAEGG